MLKQRNAFHLANNALRPWRNNRQRLCRSY